MSVGDQGREREGEEEGARRWQVLAIARAGTTYTAEKINCAAGCAFRLQAVVSGFGPDGGSSLVTPEAVLSAADFGLPTWTAAPRERKGPSPRAEGAVSDGVGGGGASALSKLLLPLALLALAASAWRCLRSRSCRRARPLGVLPLEDDEEDDEEEEEGEGGASGRRVRRAASEEEEPMVRVARASLHEQPKRYYL